MSELAGAAKKMSATLGNTGTSSPTAVSVIRNETNDRYRLKLTNRRDVPENAVIYWSLRRPPTPDKNLDRSRIELRFFDRREENPSLTLDVTNVLKRKNRVYAKFFHLTDRIDLFVDGKKADSKSVKDENK